MWADLFLELEGCCWFLLVNFCIVDLHATSNALWPEVKIPMLEAGITEHHMHFLYFYHVHPFSIRSRGEDNLWTQHEMRKS